MLNVYFTEVIDNLMYGMIANYLHISFIMGWVSHHMSNMTNNIEEKVSVLSCDILRETHILALVAVALILCTTSCFQNRGLHIPMPLFIMNLCPSIFMFYQLTHELPKSFT